MGYKEDLKTTKDKLKRTAKQKDYLSMREVAGQAVKDERLGILHTLWGKNKSGNGKNYRGAESSISFLLARSDQYAKNGAYTSEYSNKGEYDNALGKLGQAYEEARDLPEGLRDKYFDAIERRGVRLAKRAGNSQIEEEVSNLLNDIEKDRGKKRSKLETDSTTSVVASIIGILVGIFFLSPNLTGNVIGNLTNSTSNIIGAVLFAVGIVGVFFYFRKR